MSLCVSISTVCFLIYMLHRKDEMLRHLQTERQSLLSEVAGLERERESLKQQLHSAKVSLSQSDLERETQGGSDRQRADALDARVHNLEREIDELRRELDARTVSEGALKEELRASVRRYESAREVQARLEMESQRQADELDLARESLQRLAKAEAAVERYAKRLEESVNLKKELKESEERGDRYLQRIHELEVSAKSALTTARLYEQSKQRVSELERESIDLRSAVEAADELTNKLRGECERASEAKRNAEAEARSLSQQLQALLDESATGDRVGLLDDSVVAERETVSSLRERVRDLERQLITAQSMSSNVSGNDTTSVETEVLRAELAEAVAAKKERERELVESKKRERELVAELARERENDTQVYQARDRDRERELAVAQHTVKQLEERLREERERLAVSEREKEKLESYAKKTIASFKDKFVQSAQRMKDEKAALDAKVMHLQTKIDRVQETWRRDERLLSSALFEVGVKIMDRSIRQSLTPSDAHPGSALDQQRLALNRHAFASPQGVMPVGSGSAVDSATKRLAGPAGTPVALK